jgi:arginase
MAQHFEADRHTSPTRRRRALAVIGAPTNIGLRPYDDGRPRHVDRAPAALRALGIVARLGARDLGDLTAPAYRDLTRPPGGIRNEADVATYSRALAELVALGLGLGASLGLGPDPDPGPGPGTGAEPPDGTSFPIILGGDCSIILGTLLGATRGRGRIGLAYIDAHADFGIPEESLSGSVASMCLALATGRGTSPLATLSGPAPLVRAEDVVIIGRRDEGQPNYGHAALARSGALDMPDATLSARGAADIVSTAIDRIGRDELDGFWIHLDADVLHPRVMPAVDTPEPGGPDFDDLAALVRPLLRHPKALGLELTIYDPSLDPDGSCAARLVTLLETVLADDENLNGRRS